MPAKSKKQQRFFGMVHARQKGKDVGGKEVEKVAKDIDFKDADDFASTKHKGLPEKVKEKKDEHSLWEQWKGKKCECDCGDDCKCGDQCKCRKDEWHQPGRPGRPPGPPPPKPDDPRPARFLKIQQEVAALKQEYKDEPEVFRALEEIQRLMSRTMGAYL